VGLWDALKRAFAGSGAAVEADPPAPAIFAMKVEDVFSIAGRGTVVTGRIAAGSVRSGDRLVLRRASGETRSCRVRGIEKFRKVLDSAGAGEDAGLLLDGLGKSDVARGDDLASR
jgi:translation elongation factor EF-Tu-like GTPase